MICVMVRRFLILLVCFLVTFPSFCQDEGSPNKVFYKEKAKNFNVLDINVIGANGSSLPERLEAVYASVKDYSHEDYGIPTSNGVQKVNLGKIIKNR